MSSINTSSPPPNPPVPSSTSGDSSQNTTGALQLGESTVMQLLSVLFQGKQDSTAGITAAQGTTTLESMAIDEGETGVGNQSTASNVLDITNPANPPPDDDLVSQGMSLIAGLNSGSLDEQGLQALGQNVYNNLSAGGNTGPDSAYGKVIDAASGPDGTPPPKSQINAFLGGLAMVALSEILADFAKQQSQINKSMSELFLSTEKSLKEVAQDLSQNKLKETQDEVNSLIGQAVMSGIGVAMSVGGAVGAFSELSKTAENAEGKMVVAGSETKAQTYNTLGQAGSQIFTGVGSNLIQAYYTGDKGATEAKDIELQYIQQLLEKMADKYTQAGNSADSMVGSALDLIKQISEANAQAFNKF